MVGEQAKRDVEPPNERLARGTRQRADHRREDRVVVTPQGLPAFLARPFKLAIAGQLGDQAFNGERCAIHLNEPLLDEDRPILNTGVGEDRIGDQLPASAAASTVEDGDLMPPGERPEFVAALAGCPQEADPDLVDAEGVGAKRPRRLSGVRISARDPRRRRRPPNQRRARSGTTGAEESDEHRHGQRGPPDAGGREPAECGAGCDPGSGSPAPGRWRGRDARRWRQVPRRSFPGFAGERLPASSRRPPGQRAIDGEVLRSQRRAGDRLWSRRMPAPRRLRSPR